MANELEEYLNPSDNPETPLSGVTRGPNGIPRVYIGGGNKLDKVLPRMDKPLTDDIPATPQSLPQALELLSQYMNQQFSPGVKSINKLLGTGGEERYQTWPEQMVRRGVTLAGDLMTGQESVLPPGLRREDYTDIPPPQAPTSESPWLAHKLGLRPQVAQPNDAVYERAQDTAGLMGGGALVERPGVASLGSGPMRPSVAPEHPNVRQLRRGANENTNVDTDPVGKFYIKSQKENYDVAPVGTKYSVSKDPDGDGFSLWATEHTPSGQSSKLVANGLERNMAEAKANELREVSGPMKWALDNGMVDEHNPFKGQTFATEAEAKKAVRGKRRDVHDIYMEDPRSTDINGRGITNDPINLATKFDRTEAQKVLDHLNNGGKYSLEGGFKLLSDTGTPGAPLAALERAPVFYSAVENAVRSARQPTASAEQWMGFLQNQPGVKPEELQWTGVHNWLSQQKGKVSKEDLQRYLDANKLEVKDVTKGNNINVEAARDHFVADRGREPRNETELRRYVEEANEYMDSREFSRTKYEGYQLPGGENYKEHLLILPNKSKLSEWATKKLGEINRRYPNTHDNILMDNLAPDDLFGLERKGILSEPEYLKLRSELNSVDKNDIRGYRSSHWDEPNVVAHMRTNERDVGGKKSFHIEEIQSDWHQKGRKKGYRGEAIKPPDDIQAIVDKMLPGQEGRHPDTIGSSGVEVNVGDRITRAEADRLLAWQKENEGSSGIFGVPDAPFKTTWPELALKRMIRKAAEDGFERVSWTPGEAQAARYDLSKTVSKLEYNPERNVLDMYDHNGQRHTTNNVTADKLTDYVGKEAAEKLLNTELQKQSGGMGQKAHVLGDLDLKVGGEGMKGFYDKMLPKMVEKLGKQHGVKVKVANLKDGKFEVTNGKTNPDYINQPVFYFDIPPKMREQALGKGFPLFAAGLPFPVHPVDHNPFKEDQTR